MQRRQFLQAGAASSALLAVPFAPFASASAPRFELRRAESAAAGAPYLPLAAAACAGACSADALRVHMDGLHVARGSRLREFTLSALFDVDAVSSAPFLAWHYTADGRMSQRFGFVAGRASMRGFEVEYRHQGDASCRRQACALTRLDAPLLAPGHYVLVDAAAPSALAHGGDALSPLGARDFDYLAFRIEPLS